MRAGTTPIPRARGGFTLIELLVVIAIIAILAALTIGIIGGVLGNSQNKGTAQTLQKLSSILNQQVKAVIDQAKDEYKNIGTVNIAFGNIANATNPDTAKALWIQLRLRQEFPTSIAEATSSAVCTAPNGMTASLPPKPYYTRALRGVSSAGLPPNQAATFESSACLALALSPARRGMVGTLEESVGMGSLRTMNGAQVLVDLWGTPIAYLRGNDGQSPLTTATAPNPTQFPVIISAGANQKYEAGGGDDITSLAVNTGAARGD
jgi:prepilin-type N-terminal cleavage/methylation domain-containing protein